MSRGALLSALMVVFVFLAGCAQFGPSESTRGSPLAASDTPTASSVSKTSSRTSSPTIFTTSAAPPSTASSSTNATSNTTSPSPSTGSSSPTASPTNTTGANGTHVHVGPGPQYTPKTLSVAKGTAVAWHGHQPGHTVTIHKSSDPPTTTIYDKPVANNETVTYTFATAGTYNVYCETHSNGELADYNTGMTGTVTVT